MKCNKVQRLLSDYIDGVCDPSEAEGIRRHIDGCSRCAAAFRLLERTIRVMKLSAPEQPPEGYWEGFWPRLRERLACEESAREPWSRRLQELVWPWRPAAVFGPAAALMIAAVLAFNFFFFRVRGREERRTPSLRAMAPASRHETLLASRAARIGQKASRVGDIVLCDACSPIADEFVLRPARPHEISGWRPDTHYVLGRASYEVRPASFMTTY